MKKPVNMYRDLIFSSKGTGSRWTFEAVAKPVAPLKVALLAKPEIASSGLFRPKGATSQLA
ncbi:hypothetical protein [Cyclobacterium sediminis]